ncbi:MAG: FAD-dependent oxidoreductase [Verrucomicrobia bacterium]|nr:FAD-dependent oxidoreductase [Verrucomicrobiota bacterium]
MSKRIVIIGGGVIGLSTAYYCARRGHQVTVLDRAAAEHAGCSYGNAGLVVPSHFVPLAAPGMVKLGLKWMLNPESPFYIKPRLDWDLWDWSFKFWRAANASHVERSAPLLRDLNFASRACFEELADGSSGFGDFGLEKRGLLMLCKSPQTLDKEAKFAARANELGVPAAVLDARQGAALEPGVRMDIAGAVHFPEDAHLSPGRFMAALKVQCAMMGVQFRWETEACKLHLERGRVISIGARAASPRTDSVSGEPPAGGLRPEIEADEFVLCGGSWSPCVARELGLKLPMQAGKGYSLTLPQPRQLPGIPCIFTEARLAVTPMGGALRFGGTMEIAGLNEDINPARVRGIVNSVPGYFPEFTARDFAGVQPWCGLRPCSPDGLPYLGRTAKFTNLAIATGHAMMGLSLGPLTGRLLAQILSGENPEFDLTRLNPDRYG